jgi:hypothetical protein
MKVHIIPALRSTDIPTAKRDCIFRQWTIKHEVVADQMDHVHDDDDKSLWGTDRQAHWMLANGHFARYSFFVLF